MDYTDYKIGEIVKVEVIGIQTYGVFVKLDEDTQGLVHISEVQHGFVENLEELFNVGDEIKVMIIDIDEYNGKISLSLRSLQKTDHHPFSNKRKNPRYGKKTGIGFETLKKALPKWMEKGQKRLNN